MGKFHNKKPPIYYETKIPKIYFNAKQQKKKEEMLKFYAFPLFYFEYSRKPSPRTSLASDTMTNAFGSTSATISFTCTISFCDTTQ